MRNLHVKEGEMTASSIHPYPPSPKAGQEDILIKAVCGGSCKTRFTLRNYQSGTAFRGEKGFTLLELLISIMIIAIIVLIIMGALRLGTRSVDAGEKKIQYFERIRSSFNIIDAQIQSHIPLSYVDNGEPKYYFQGERESMRFSTNYSIWGGEKGYVVVAYSVKTGDNGKQVLYATENIVGMEGTRETKLFDNFDRIYFEYFFKDPTEEQGTWVDQWSDESSTPAKIRIHLIEGAEDLSMIIPMRVIGEPSGLASSVVREEE